MIDLAFFGLSTITSERPLAPSDEPVLLRGFVVDVARDVVFVPFVLDDAEVLAVWVDLVDLRATVPSCFFSMIFGMWSVGRQDGPQGRWTTRRRL